MSNENTKAAPKTIVTYPITGQNEYRIPFEYLARKYVVVTLVNPATRLTLVLGTDYRFASNTLIAPIKSTAGWESIEIRRITSATDRLVDFKDGSILRAGDLNLAQLQTLHVADEARDLAADGIVADASGVLDARGRRIKNLAEGINANDACTIGQLWFYDNSTFNNAKAAEAAARLSAEHRAGSEEAARLSITQATKSEEAASLAAKHRTASEEAAILSAGHRAGSEAAARRSEQARDTILNTELTSLANANKAEEQAAIAKREADRLVNNNAFAGTLETVVGNRITFKPNAKITIDRIAAGEVVVDTTFACNAAISYFNQSVNVGKYLYVGAGEVGKGTIIKDGLVSSHGSTVAGATFVVTDAGTHIGWNESKNLGESVFVNNRGGGEGGFVFRTVTADASTTTARWVMNSDGTFYTKALSADNVTARAKLTVSGAADFASSITVKGRVTANSAAVSGSVEAGSITCSGAIRGNAVVSDGNVYAGGTSKGFLLPSGNINGTVWGGYLHDYLANTAYLGQTVGGRVKYWTDVGNGFLSLIIDGQQMGINFAPSDACRKEFMREHKCLEGIVDIFRAVKSISYKYIDRKCEESGTAYKGHNCRFGFTTQDLQKVWPEAVHILPDGSGIPNTNEIIGGLMAMVKSLDSRCSNLERTIENLEARINNL